MERLIEDANKLKATQGEVANLTIDSYADVIEAIHTVQGEMNITGTTAKEASGTITGSIETMKAAWENLLAGMADPNADIKGLMDNLVESIGNVATNLAPAIGNFISAFSELASEGIHAFNDYMNSSEGQAAASNAVNNIATWIGENTGPMLEAGATLAKVLLQGLFEGLIRVGQNNAAEYLEETGAWTAEEVQNAMDEAWAAWHEGKGLKAAMAAYKKSLEDSAHEGGTAFVDTTRSKIDDAIAAGKALADGTVDGSDSTDGMSENGTAAAEAYVNSVSGSYDDSESAGELIANGAEVGMKSQHNNASTWGKDLVSNFAAGMRSNFGIVGAAASGLAALIKSYIHFTEPDLGPLSDFHTYAPDMVELFAQGLRENASKIEKEAKSIAQTVSDIFSGIADSNSTLQAIFKGKFNLFSSDYDNNNTDARELELQISEWSELADQQKRILEEFKASIGDTEDAELLAQLEAEQSFYDDISSTLDTLKERLDAVNDASNAEKLTEKLSWLNQEQEQQAETVAAAAEAYLQMKIAYGDTSDEANEMRETLLKEKQAYSDITGEIQEANQALMQYNQQMSIASSFAGQSYEARISYANSALAKVNNSATGRTDNIVINVTSEIDGKVLAQSTYDYNQAEANRRGNNLVS